MEKIEIAEEKNVYNDYLLDLMGADFKFSHEKGLAEWLKNSADAYLRAGRDDAESFIVFRVCEGDQYFFEVIDFVGMTSDDIDKAAKIWGDPAAAKRGMSKGSRTKTFGGHGNGGKFYMRQMFKEAQFITYREGKLNVFGFNEKKKYGFAKGFRDKHMSPEHALKVVSISKMAFPSDIRQQIMDGRLGFTVTRGIKPIGVGAKQRFNLNRLCEKLKHSPQARQVIKHKPVSVMFNDDIVLDRLALEEIPAMLAFSEPAVVTIPATLIFEEADEKETVVMANEAYPQGTLTLYTSDEPLSRNSRFGDLNRIEMTGEIGIIASYRIQEIGYVKRLSSAEFIYGECRCPILEDPNESCVSNDRNVLMENVRTKALRKWISGEIDALAAKIDELNKKDVRAKNIKVLNDFNSLLNKWKDTFMSSIMKEVLGGAGIGEGIGTGEGGKKKGKKLPTSTPEPMPEPIVEPTPEPKPQKEKHENNGGGSEKKHKQSYPSVLLSGMDEDPLAPGSLLQLSDRQPPVYQRPDDVAAGIYWINTARKTAQFIIETYGVENMKWRDYHFQRIIDVICKEGLHNLLKKDPENFNADTVDAEIIDKLVSKAHDDAMDKLKDYLFEDGFKSKQGEFIDNLKKRDPKEREEFSKEVMDTVDLL